MRKSGGIGMATILISTLLALVVLAVAWIWVDGGRRPLRTIVEPVQPQANVAPAGAGA